VRDATPIDPPLSWAQIVATTLGVGIAVMCVLFMYGTAVGTALVGAGAGAAAVVVTYVLGRALAVAQPEAGKARDTRWTALLDSGTDRTRETLAVVEQLTDPLAIEHRIATEMRALAGVERLELLRAPDAPQGTLTQASLADGPLLQAAIGPGVLRRTGAVPELSAAMEALHADVVIAVRYDARVYGLLAIEGRLRGSELLQARRFADLLAFKLELHRVYGELAHREQLAALGSFASAIAHDLRTPLSSISLSLQALAEKRAVLGADAELVDIATEETQRLESWVRELVDSSRPIHLQPHAMDPGPIIATVARSHERVAAQAGVQLRVEAAPELPWILGEPSQLERALDNLVGNAISVAPRGSDVKIEARALAAGVRIDVVDRGPGIAAADHERIFEPFFTRRAGGTGLGLATARRIVTAHGGSIEVDSAIGRGTRMSVLLPRKGAAPGRG
jgi:signal transduction histidine kinase